MTLPRPGFIAMLTSALLVLMLAALAIGPQSMDAAPLIGAVTGRGDDASAMILFDIRLPRLIAAAMVGATLGMAGAALQGLTRNPLAEPGLLGVSACATLGATLTLYFGIAAAAPMAVQAGAITGALIATALAALFARRMAGINGLILAGVGLSSFAGALMALLLNFAPNPFSLSDMINWTLGSVANRSLNDCAAALPFIAVGMALMLSAARGLSLLVLGEAAAAAHGLNLRSLRWRVIGGTGVAVGGAVALAGAIGFVGIVAPHLVKARVGHVMGRALLPSALVGAMLTVGADMLVRLLPTTTELKLGVVAALFGAPLFLYIALRSQGDRDD
ncbi:MAG: hypothetical protein RLZZ58_218 [Pseudomonadota bacterium]